MKESAIKRIMIGLIFFGIGLILIGLYLIFFTDVSTTKGTQGIFMIAGFIAAGLFVSVPAKIYLTLQLMKLNDDRLRASNKTADDPKYEN